ncbi:MAG: peptide deformylase [Chloroflexi bacterium]|nr:peptide deformylase [Chloroflexota bacterium]
METDLSRETETEDERPPEPRIRVLRNAKPWRIDASRRTKWSSDEFVRRHALEIRQVGDPVLHAPAKKPALSKKELEELVARMFASMVAARGIGIAAPQIGVPLRIAIMDVDETGFVCIDPKVAEVSEEVEETSEGCLSVRGFYGMLERPLGVRISATDLNGKKFVIEGDDVGAQCLLHETDHLSGMLYIDRLRSREDLHVVEPDETEEVTASASE